MIFAGKQIIRNLLAGWFSIAFRAIIALLLVPFLISHLGKDGYGLIALMGVITSLALVADLGLRGALGRELAVQRAKADYMAFSELASTAFLLYVVIATFLAIAGWILAPLLVVLFKVDPDMQNNAIWMIRIYGGASVLFSFISPVFRAALGSYNRFDLVHTIEVIGRIVSALLLFAVIPIVGNPLYGWAGVMLLFQLVMFGINIIFFRKYCDGAALSIRFLNLKRLLPLLHLGSYMYAFQLARTISEHSDPLVISYFFGPAGVALYNPGGKLSKIVRPLVTMLSTQLLPLATKSHVEGNIIHKKRILYDGTRFILLLGSLFSVGIGVFAMPFCRLWLESSIGEDYRIVALIMTGWAVVDFTTYVAGTSWSVMLGMGVKVLKPGAIIRIIAAVINIGISVWLVGYSGAGIPGVLLATITISLIIRPVFMAIVAKFNDLSFREYIFNAQLRGLVVAGVFLVSMLGIHFLFEIDSFVELFGVAITAGLIWLFLCWCLGLKNNERYVLLGFIKRRLNRCSYR